jgi:hypothetical protein
LETPEVNGVSDAIEKDSVADTSSNGLVEEIGQLKIADLCPAEEHPSNW